MNDQPEVECYPPLEIVGDQPPLPKESQAYVHTPGDVSAAFLAGVVFTIVTRRLYTGLQST